MEALMIVTYSPGELSPFASYHSDHVGLVMRIEPYPAPAQYISVGISQIPAVAIKDTCQSGVDSLK